MKEKAELDLIEHEQKMATQYDLHWKMKEQCIQALGLDLYQKIHQRLKKYKEGLADFMVVHDEVAAMVGNDKEKMNKIFLIDQIIECEKNKNYT